MKLNVPLSDDAYNEIMKRLAVIEIAVKSKQMFGDEVFFDSQEFMQVMHISKKLAQQWRDRGIIGFSKVGEKIYYKLSDIKALLEKNYKHPKK